MFAPLEFLIGDKALGRLINKCFSGFSFEVAKFEYKKGEEFSSPFSKVRNVGGLFLSIAAPITKSIVKRNTCIPEGVVMPERVSG